MCVNVCVRRVGVTRKSCVVLNVQYRVGVTDKSCVVLNVQYRVV